MTLRQQQAAPGRHSALLNTNCWSARIDPKRTFWSLMGILFDQIVSFVLLKWDYFPIFPKMCKMIDIYGRCCGNQSVRPHTTPLLLVPPGLGPLSDIQQASQSHHPSTINQSLSSIWLWWPIRASLWLGIRVGSNQATWVNRCSFAISRVWLFDFTAKGFWQTAFFLENYAIDTVK